MAINVLGVVGAGQMGSGIAQVAAACGLSVVMNDIKDEFVERGYKTIEGSLGRLVKKRKDDRGRSDKIRIGPDRGIHVAGGYDSGGLCGGSGHRE